MNDRLPPFPIVKIELTGMQQTICHAMSEHLAKLDTDVQAAVNAAVTAYNPRDTIERETRRLIDEGIKSALENFFRYGEGRDAVNDAIGEHLRKNIGKKSKR